MKTTTYLFLALSCSLFLAPRCLGQQADAQEAPPRYRMELVYIFESNTTEYIFTIGSVGFKSVDSLRRFISNLPPNSILEWAPGCGRAGNEPLLSSEQEMQEFKDFCESHGVKFVLIPSG